MSPASSVLQVVTDTDRRGAQIFATDLEQPLRDLGWSVETVALAPGRVGGLPVPVLGPSRRSMQTLLGLRRRARHVDVVVAHGSTTLPACAIALARLRKPLVYRQISDSLFWANTPRRRVQTRLSLRRTAAVIALWSGSADTLIAHFGVTKGKLAVVPNGVPDTFKVQAPESRPSARQELGIDPHRPTVVFIGALVPEKGTDLAIRAIGSCPEAQLLVAGDGPQRSRLEELGESCAPDRVHFLGSVGDVRDVLNAGDLIVLPSRGGDSMPAVLIEAGLSGLPTVATPIGGIVDIVKDGETGVLVPPNEQDAVTEAIRGILCDPAGAVAMGLRARAHCLDRFEISRVARGWDAVLRDIVHPPSVMVHRP